MNEPGILERWPHLKPTKTFGTSPKRIWWNDARRAQFEQMWRDNVDAEEIADFFEISAAYVNSKASAWKLGRRRPRGRPKGQPRSFKSRLRSHGGTLRRFVGAKGRKMLARKIDPDRPYIKEGRTRYGRRVISASKAKHVLVDGVNSSKIGGRVMKGPWKGMPIATLTLEERFTCPKTCKQWLTCYGNNMHLALRIRHDEEDFSIHLASELLRLNARYPDGFVVRLHVLGDFFSLKYVAFWRDALDVLPGLHVFGYTARPVDSPIGAALREIVMDKWDRFAMRWSDRGSLLAASEVIDDVKDAAGVVCPAEGDENRSCSTCALCWASKPGARPGKLIPAVPLISFPRH